MSQFKRYPLALLCTAPLLSLTFAANAATLDIAITNLTQGIYFTPVIVATHDSNYHFFEAGTPASTSLQAMAEGGDIAGLAADALAAGANVVKDPNGGLLQPGQSIASFNIEAGAGAMLSLAAMLLPTNDGFAGIDSWPIPAQAGSYAVMVNAYDAGTEINNELIVAGAGGPGQIGIPADPTAKAGTSGSGVSAAEENMMIHIHRGTLGDDSSTDGISDLDNTVHRWLNPVLKVTIIVK